MNSEDSISGIILAGERQFQFQFIELVGELDQAGKNISSEAIYVVSAHYDCSEGSMGANDDGSGVAGMLAIADILSKYSFNHTIQFIAFSGEEVGTLGSFTSFSNTGIGRYSKCC